VTGAIGIPINGALGDAFGLQRSLMSHAILIAVTIGIALLLPNEREMERYAAPAPPPAEPLKASVVT